MSAGMHGGVLDRRLGWAIFLGVLGVYLLTASREPPWADAFLMFEVAEGLVDRGSVEVTFEWPPMSHRGSDGGLYAQYALLPSLVSIPGVWILRFLGPHWQTFMLPVVSQLAPAISAALACVLLFVLVRRFGGSARAAVITTAILAFSTMMWVYARRPYAEATQTACLLGFLWTLIRGYERPSRSHALLSGIAAGLLINAKLVFGLSVVAGYGAMVVLLWHRRRVLIDYLAWVTLGALPLLVVLLVYNHVRWGHPLITGYEQTLQLARQPMGWGLFGLLFSPGRSVFLYNPPLILGVLYLPRLLRMHPRKASLLLVVTLPAMLYHGHLLVWSGGWCWGPRFWMFAVPVLLVPLAIGIDRLATLASRWRRRTLATMVITVALLGAGVQVVGNAFYWDHYLRLSRRVQRAWLGNPDRSGAAIDPRDRGHCDGCFEDMYGTIWLPPLQPIAGHTWLLRHIVAGDSAHEAMQDAPWRRHTSAHFGIEGSYRRTRLDWWGFLWLDDHPDRQPIGVGLLALFAVIAATGVGLGYTALRRGSTDDEQRDLR